MRFSPHDYQKFVINYILKHPICAVLLDMGLGKTVITLSALSALLFDYFQSHKILVIAPLRVAKYTWREEMVKWEHLHKIRYSIVVGTPKQRAKALSQKADMYIINRENIDWLVNNYEFDFDTVIIDELSSFKNIRTKRFKALFKVRPKIKRIVGLTGTPTSNGLMDLFSEYKLLDMGKRLGLYLTQYRAKYFIPEYHFQNIPCSFYPAPGAQDKIFEQISDITVSMRSIDHIKMPELISTTVRVEMSEEERKIYDTMKNQYVISLGGQTVTGVNAAVIYDKLSQLANGAIYSDSHCAIKIHDRKIDALEDIIESMNGKPLLVAYWYQHDRDRIIELLERLDIPYVRLDKSKGVEAWNSGQVCVGLIHPESAGHGLNLQAGGSTLVWFGLTWSLELYQQTIARLWRQGQKSKTVVIQHIIAKDTIDEKIMEALERKNVTQTTLMEAVKACLPNHTDKDFI